MKRTKYISKNRFRLLLEVFAPTGCADDLISALIDTLTQVVGGDD